MSRNYKFSNKQGLYFTSFAVVNWIDVFTRSAYCDIIVDSLNFCSSKLGMKVYCWCIMPSHIHLIFSATDNNPEILIGRLKEYTSKKIVKSITENIQESRREWLLWMFRNAAKKSSNVSNLQFWQHDSHPIELWTAEIIKQKTDYIHNNPIVSGFVMEAVYWKYSSAIDYCGGDGLVLLAG